MILRTSLISFGSGAGPECCVKSSFLLILVITMVLSLADDHPHTQPPGLSEPSKSLNLSQVWATASGGSGAGLCRDRLGTFPASTFRLLTCGMCFMFLYNGKHVNAYFTFKSFQIVFVNSSGSPVDFAPPDVSNESVVENVCRVVRQAKEDCTRWTSCCQAAENCCQRQLALGDVTSATENEAGSGKVEQPACPRTWDGFSCWDDATAGSMVTKPCPGYIEHSSDSGFATKYCRENGTWYTNPESSQEWTDYTTCVQLDMTPVSDLVVHLKVTFSGNGDLVFHINIILGPHFEALFWVSVVCNIFSLVLLLPACFIFLYFRSLRHQHRIKLHLCLFSSYVFTSGAMLLWESLVVSDRLYRDTNDTIMHQNSVGCRFLFAVTRYAWTTNFLWMWLEGFHLFRLMVQAFAVPRSLVGFYIGGFSSPLVPVLVYSIIRASIPDLNTRCWVHNAGDIEWIIYVPILFCLAGNVFFLGKILWVMLNQLQSHPNEPSSYRRAVKAAAILIPLFGLQALLVMIRPPTSSFAFDVVSRIVSNTQGAAVAVGFCYLNGEVLSVVKNVLPHSLRSRVLLRSDQRSTVSTQFTTDAVSRTGYGQSNQTSRACLSGSSETNASFRGQHGAGYIPLSTMSDESKDKVHDEVKLGNGAL